MSSAPHPTLSVKGDVATLVFPGDDYTLDFRSLAMNQYGALYAVVTARHGEQILHAARFDLLNQREQELFNQRCHSVNETAADWQSRLQAALPGLREFATDTVTAAPGTGPWEPLQPLPALLPEVPMLPSTMLPDGLKGWVEDIAERAQVPLEYVAIPALIGLAAVVGRRIGIYPKQQDDWLVIPNLWGAIVGRSGLLKTPTLQQALKPLDRLAMGAIDAYAAAEERAEGQRVSLDAQIAGVKEALKKAAKDNKSCEEHEARLATLQAQREDLGGHLRRFKTNDTTIAKLGELLRDNPDGLLFFRDELSGWLSSLSQEGREGDREFFLETWNGDGNYTFDRIGRGSIYVKGLCLSIVGGIQPGKLLRYVHEACEGGIGDDGLLQRFQLLVWPEPPRGFNNIDRWPYREERDRAYSLYERLADLDPETIGATSTGYTSIPALRFTPDAQELFDTWRGELETRVRSGAINSPAFESHLAKYRSLMPSLALLFHLLDRVEECGGMGVSLRCAQLAAEWCDFLEAHARKVYAGVLNKDLQAAHAIKAKIEEEAISTGQSPRDIYRAQWSLLRTPEDVYGGLGALERHGWVRVTEVRGPKGGRSTEVIHLHPELTAKDSYVSFGSEGG
jgi:putative DNA primase/helicase